MPQGFWRVGFVDLWHPGVMLTVVVVGGAYLLAVVGPWRRHFPDAEPVPPARIAYFLGGLVAMYLAVGSPLDHLSDDYLFSAHMLEHVLLIFVLDPLVLLGTPAWLVRPLWRRPTSRRILLRLTRPLTGLGAFTVVFSLWHVPTVYGLTLTNETVHFTEHATFVFTGLLMWWPLLSPLPEAPRLSDPLQILYCFANEIAQTAVFALITFSGTPSYSFYVHAPRAFGLGPLEDQQLGGIIMRLGGMSAYILCAFLAFLRWVRSDAGSRVDPLPEIGTPRR